MVRIEEDEHGYAITSEPLCLRFAWIGIRWSHTLLIENQPLAHSLEMTPGRDGLTRMISPAYQQFSHQEHGGVIQAMLVGQWGHHHSSAVFTVEEQSFGVLIGVDVAVRSRGELKALAATYFVQRRPNDQSDANPSMMVWNLEGQEPSRLRFEARAPSVVSLAEGGRQATCIQANGRVESKSSTQRLYYRWEWFPC